MDIADKHTGHTHEGSSNNDDKDLLAVKIASIFIVFLCTLAGAIGPLRLRKAPDTNTTVISCLNCLGGGIFLGFGFLHVLPDAIEGFESVDTNGFPLIYFLCLCGFFLILMAERYFITIAESISHSKGKAEDCSDACVCDPPSNDTEMLPSKSHDGHQHSHDFHTHAIPVNTKSPYLPFILTLGLSFHSIFEGLALSLNGEMTGLIVFLIGICVHKAAECFAMGVNFWRSQVPLKKWIALTVTYAAVTPAGIIIGLILSETLSGRALDVVSSILQAIAVGAFLYVAILGVVVEEFSNNANLLLKSFLFFVGLTCMGCLGILEIAEGSD